eukprot:gnl/TRDRNA2_/TRDRNA2_177589_c0_seq1.p1 gnl/TRDRNA2_/TRDRNA2_177589_c0~~gnl/TRDRNA2_/TRDRNA2_177589_c0_seq1.p1  ORF type:complete len:507 (-),score=-47.22 gnl/TRDRNA2_/TRDRNA2_177589_c0_seq1:558-2078(-)
MKFSKYPITNNSVTKTIEDLPGIWNHTKIKHPTATSFINLGYDKTLLREMQTHRIFSPSAIQEMTHPHFLMGSDLAVPYHSGSGKTFSYLLPLLSKISSLIHVNNSTLNMESSRITSLIEYDCPYAIIVVPTVDLAFQIVHTARSLIPKENLHFCLAITGGVNSQRLMKSVRKQDPLIIVGTPGRLVDMNRQSYIQLHKINTLILDELDYLLTPSHIKDMELITSHSGLKLCSGPHTILVSATLTPENLSSVLEKKWSRNSLNLLSPDLSSKKILPNYYSTLSSPFGPLFIYKNYFKNISENCSRMNIVTSSRDISINTNHICTRHLNNTIHLVIKCSPKTKIDTLISFLKTFEAKHCILFVNSLQNIKYIKNKISKYNSNVAILHSGLKTQERKAVINCFRSGKTEILITSDTTSRGMDFRDCALVCNLEVPSSFTNYILRAGRAGRSGQECMVVTTYTEDQKFIINYWERNSPLDFHEVKVLKQEIIPIKKYIQMMESCSSASK